MNPGERIALRGETGRLEGRWSDHNPASRTLPLDVVL